MAKTKTKTKGGTKSRKSAGSKTTKSARASARSKVTAKRPVVKQKKAAKKKPLSAATSAAPQAGVLTRMFKRVKPIFQTPLDPRIKHLVDVFGEEAVRGVVKAYRTSKKVAAHEISEALARFEQLRPKPAHGSFTWFELMTHDTNGAKRFYGQLFGWDSYDMEMMPGFNYTLFKHGGKDFGGMMAITPEQGEMHPGWSIYVAVDDVDAAAEKAEALGGSIEVPPHDIPVGRWAMVRDPSGATVCLYKSSHG